MFVFASLALALASSLVACVFLTFSEFVIPSLTAARPATGAEAMQAINRRVYSSVFMALFLGLTAVTGGVAIYAARPLPQNSPNRARS